MIVSIERLGLIAALLAGSAAASAQDERDLYLRTVPIQRPHVPDLLDRPPCIDGALLGALRRDTHELIIDPHSPYRGSTRYWFEFRPARDWDSEMRRRGHSAAFLAQVADAGDFNLNWVQWRDGRAVVARGVYLDALPAMFARQTPAGCRRPAPDLANRNPSR